MMLLLKVVGIAAIVLAALFLLSLVIYYFNLDMKLAMKMMPVMHKIYDAGNAERARKAQKSKDGGKAE